MNNLIITIAQKTITDYDGNLETIKEASSSIGGVATNVIKTYDLADTDPTITTDYEAYLTSLGFTWDN